ncbi:MAG: hypothetical protein A3F83_09505 [Candidatus Glassbacteria bacterium RIFCSPLOWO2_12_FULL_58_11]|uniref:Uncharacterized protein n=1 Tax=Candidatus Glassbacteria bacterium RIFCSPLOWO2_12_FULL_58_11 TaxID=1817867 RepID=A0A1F5YYA7_9BACT|nr:MAG: hypothetical protein A3F83_09505 [Candidatus Glassbacteria bacterium RIFCSPLOWO2_12_FULL_58_11]
MREKKPNTILRAFAAAVLLVSAWIPALLAQQGTGRPKVLVLQPASALDSRIAEGFQWDLAKALDKSGYFDIVSEKDYDNFLKENKLTRGNAIPDSLLPLMMDTLKASIYTSGTLEQPDGRGTALKAKVDYIYPKNDYTIEGEQCSVGDEKNTAELAKQAIQVIIRASEKISALSIARSYFNSAIYDKALENYLKLLAIEPKDVNVHYMLGLCYLKMDSTDAAIRKFEEILTSIHPNHIPTLELVASTYFGRNDFENAMKTYKILAGLKPDEYQYTYGEAFALIKLERKDEAMEAFNRLVKIKDEDEKIRMQIGSMEYSRALELEQAGDTAAAQKHAAQASINFGRSAELSQKMQNPDQKMICDCLNYQALSNLKAGDRKGALESFAKLVALDPAYPNAYYWLAVTAYNDSNYTKALDYFNEAVKYVAVNMQAAIYQRIGQIYENRKDYSSATDAFTNALKTADASVKIRLLFQRGTTYYEWGNALDYATNENADMDELIENGQMSRARADQALALYDKAAADLQKVTDPKLAKSVGQHVENIGQLRERLNKIKQQIEYVEKTK